ncbi:hypothetical protein [Hyphomicrobium sp. D-2]|uniref:hypothetical protein n=1 Tax=Hyphomicrobium sp. D-2 TaxID=3041621 RepID=UPI0024549DAB|nr:hypothetical protein [Hyphomicrobium sp. D-2]MDH4982154.1 hypothetical protein [Hyphomicrobium sp. D-2]
MFFRGQEIALTLVALAPSAFFSPDAAAQINCTGVGDPACTTYTNVNITTTLPGDYAVTASNGGAATIDEGSLTTPGTVALAHARFVLGVRLIFLEVSLCSSAGIGLAAYDANSAITMDGGSITTQNDGSRGVSSFS